MNEIPDEIKSILNRWYRQARVLRTVHACLGIAAIISSLLVAAKINSFETTYIEWLAFIAAVTVGLMSGFNLGDKANQMMRAWRLLNAAALKFKHEEKPDQMKLIKAYEDAESIIGDVKAEVT